MYNACTGAAQTISVADSDATALAALAAAQSCVPFALSAIKEPGVLSEMKRQTKMMMLNYHQIKQFTHMVNELFTNNNIHFVLLKGISLAQYYSVPEYRKLGDIDIYLSNYDMFKRACDILKSNNFIKYDEVSDHHEGYTYYSPKAKRTFTVELHFRVVGLYQYAPANRLVDSIFSEDALELEPQKIDEDSYSVLAPTQYTFYMLHHMLKHYLYSGFGLRLLLDFTFYLKARSDEIDFNLIHEWCAESKILHLYELLIETCRIYLGLPQEIDPSITANADDCEEFMVQLLADGDVSEGNSQKLVGSGTYKNVNLITYFKEGHIQMKVRFPHLSKCPLLWPALWTITFAHFIYNNHHFRKSNLTQILREFKSDNQRSRLLQIFDNSKN